MTRGGGIPVGVRGSGASLAGGLGAGHHQSRSPALRPVLRALPQSERISMPDFDIDFCQERRDEVVRYVREKYGHDRVAQIMALGSLQARAAVRDAGRVLQMPLGLVDRIAKLIPNPPGKPVSLRDAIDSEPRLQDHRRAGTDGAAAVRHHRQDRGALPPCLDPSGGRGDRRPAFGRDFAALPRSALRHAGDPVRLRGRGKSRAGEVRFPRPQDPHCHRQGGGIAGAAGHRAAHPDHRFRQPGGFRDAGARRQRGSVPARRLGHARPACAR